VKQPRSAFSLLEIMVVICIMALMAAIIIPRLLFRTPQAEWPTILADLNDVVFFARQEAISNQKVYRLTFKSYAEQSDTVAVEEELDDQEKPGKKIYRQASSFYFNTKYTFHESVKLKAVYHGKDEFLTDNKGEGYCYVIPDGLVQDIIIYVIRKDKEKGVEIPASFILSPFFGKFEFHDGFVRPG